MSDLDEVAALMRTRHGRRLRVATKYVNLTRRFFAEKGVADYRIVESLGATEGAPAAGSAEIVVDITTTGATLSANALKVLDDGIILRSEANLVASLKAPWGEDQRTALRTVLGRIAARSAPAPPGRSGRPAGERHDRPRHHRGPARGELPYGAPARERREIVMRCPRGPCSPSPAPLVEAGARAVTVRRVDYAFAAENPLAERLLARL